MDSYDTLKTAAILFTVVVLGCFVTFWVRHSVALTHGHMILMAFAMTYTTVFFLPAMHDRYGYVYEILAIIIAFMMVKTAPLAIAMICTSLTMYGVFLYHQNFNETTVAVINLIIYLAYMIIVNKELLKESEHAI